MDPENLGLPEKVTEILIDYKNAPTDFMLFIY
jgi:hypothetical protein